MRPYRSLGRVPGSGVMGAGADSAVN